MCRTRRSFSAKSRVRRSSERRARGGTGSTPRRSSGVTGEVFMSAGPRSSPRERPAARALPGTRRVLPPSTSRAHPTPVGAKGLERGRSSVSPRERHRDTLAGRAVERLHHRQASAALAARRTAERGPRGSPPRSLRAPRGGPARPTRSESWRSGSRPPRRGRGRARAGADRRRADGPAGARSSPPFPRSRPAARSPGTRRWWPRGWPPLRPRTRGWPRACPPPRWHGGPFGPWQRRVARRPAARAAGRRCGPPG